MGNIYQTFKLERFISPYQVPGAYDGLSQKGSVFVFCGGEVVVSGSKGEVVVVGEGVVVALGEGEVVAAGEGEIEGTIKEFLGYIRDNQDGGA